MASMTERMGLGVCYWDAEERGFVGQSRSTALRSR
jgi:hypothetical protein